MSRTSANTIQSSANKSVSDAEELSRQFEYFSGALLISSIMDSMPGIGLVLNRHNQIVFANRAFCELSGKQSAEMLCGQLLGDVLDCHIAKDATAGCGSGDSCETCGALTAMLSSVDGQNKVQECMITRGDGDLLHNLTLRVWTSPIQYGGEAFTVLAGMDISHERRRLALERTFFHDILNLVGSIRGFAELMEIDDNVDSLEVCRRIQIASQRVIDEIDAQRVLLAVEKGELKINNHLLASQTILNDIVELYESQDVARNRQVIISAESVNCSFVSDATLLRRILGNMVKNALEATVENGSVSLGAKVDGTFLQFWVQNDSVIPKGYQQRIFQRDFSTKGAGRGLGTYSMKLLGRFLSGDVSFRSEEGFGTRFTLSLPLSLPEGINEQLV